MTQQIQRENSGGMVTGVKEKQRQTTELVALFNTDSVKCVILEEASGRRKCVCVCVCVCKTERKRERGA